MIASLKAMDATARMIVALFASAIVLCAVAIFYLLITAGPRERAREAERYAARIEQARKADDAASSQRAKDLGHIDQRKMEHTDEIAKQPDNRPSPARLAHACQRLRHQGTAEARLPAECRAGG